MNNHEIDRQAQAKPLSDRELENVTGSGWGDGKKDNELPGGSRNNDYRYCPQCGSIVPVHSAKTGGWVCDLKGHWIF